MAIKTVTGQEKKRVSSGLRPQQESRSSHDDPRSSAQTILAARGVVKTFRNGATETPVLKGVDLEIKEGQLTAIVGKSGSGKSTLLHLLGTLDSPDEGKIYFREQRIDNLAPKRAEEIRNREIGLIFQFYHLLPELSVLENVLTPLMIRHGIFSYFTKRRQLKERAKELLDRVGMSHRLNHKPLQLSGGERQRTAIARALISDPVLLLADEPTGNLDAENGAEVLELLESLNRKEGMSVVMVTHDDQIAANADHVIRVVHGVVEESF